MLSDFEAEGIKQAKKILENDLVMAKKNHLELKEREKKMFEKPSLWKKVKAFFSDLF